MHGASSVLPSQSSSIPFSHASGPGIGVLVTQTTSPASQRVVPGAHGALRSLVPNIATTRSLLEVGCGSGFLSLYAMEALARAGSSLEEIHLIDIEPQALTCGMAAIEKTAGRTVVTASLGRRGEALRVRGRYDLVLMNPPYIRRPPELTFARYKDNPWEGVALIRELADRAPEILTPGGSLILVVSSLCDDLAMPWLSQSLEVETLAELDVPLKVYAVVSRLTHKSREWMEFLRATEGLAVHDPPRDGYDAWQTIRVLRCRPRPA